jgi:NitT/TauT family transport system substrate-binding protein
LNARDLLSALGSGQVDVGGTAVRSGLFNAIACDLTTRIVAPLARIDPGASPLFWMVRKDLFESNQFNDYSDLAGKKIAAASVGGTADYLVSLGLQLD